MNDAVPMINVAFLLLIFFMLAAQIAPPDPIEIDLPEAVGGAPVKDPDALFVGADGSLAFGELRDRAAFGAAVGRDRAGPLILRVDRAFSGPDLAGLLGRLREAGLTEVWLSVAPAT